MLHIFTNKEYSEYLWMHNKYKLLETFKEKLLAKAKAAIDNGTVKCWRDSACYCDDCILGSLGIAPHDTNGDGRDVCLAGKIMEFSK